MDYFTEIYGKQLIKVVALHWATLVVFATLSHQNMASEFHMYESPASEDKDDVERLSHWSVLGNW